MNQTREIYLLAAFSYLKKKSGCIWNLLYHLIPELTNIRNISSIPYESKIKYFYPWSGFPHQREGQACDSERKGFASSPRKKMLIRVFDGTFFGHPEINVTRVSPKIIHQKQAMSQVISLMELEWILGGHGLGLESGKKKKKLPSHLD